MFRTLGLFASYPCPAEPCTLSGCLFRHEQIASTTRASKRRKLDVDCQTEGQGGSELETKNSKAALDIVKSKASVDWEDLARQKNEFLRKKALELSVTERKNLGILDKRIGLEVKHKSEQVIPAINMEVSQPDKDVDRKPDPRYISRSSAGDEISIRLDPMCRIAHESRLHYLRLYKKQFERIYAGLDNETFAKLATDHAIEQEQYVMKKNNKGTYKQASKNVLIGLGKRQAALDPSDVGIHPLYKPPQKKIILWESLVHTIDTLKKWGYTTEIPDPDATMSDEEGCDRICDRCTQRFIVTSDEEKWLTCIYHPGKSMYKTEAGARTTNWSCCESKSTGCCTSPTHVFKINHAPRLAAYHPYTKLPYSKNHGLGDLDVVALDCEMVYTTASMELARISITDKSGTRILDEFITPENKILDLNTRYSGITSAQLTTHGIPRSLLSEKLEDLGITNNTIMIGHGLENDLTALRLIHHRVIDSAILFPHPRGRPYRNSLKYLVKRYLSRDIQMNAINLTMNESSEIPLGHDPTEDAKGALDLVIWKATHGDEKVGDTPFSGKLK